VVKQSGYYTLTKQPVGSDFPDYTSLDYSMESIHPNVCKGMPPIQIIPKEKGKYEITVRIYEKNIGFCDCTLPLTVID
jgi:hypothetical protein